MTRWTLTLAACVVALLLDATAHAHSVAQVLTAKRISQATATLLDPQGSPVPGGAGTDTRARVGDILTFVIQFTPVPNNATQGAGGYITEYVPANTEVVGARLVDGSGQTVAPKRGPQMDDGWGPRGRHDGFDGMGLAQGSLSQVYADTGIFFSADPRTARQPANEPITLLNGLVVTPSPTGGGQLDGLLGFTGPPFYAHNLWDRIQAIAYGANGGVVVSNGTGNTPFGFGSAVAGPLTHYMFEKVATPACSDGADNDGDGSADYPADAGCASSLDDDETAATSAPVGPWQRIRSFGSEIGSGAATDCQSCAGEYVRTGVSIDTGWDLSPDNPLPSGTNAVRFAVGELVVGQEYLAEISLRVTGLPLDPAMNADVDCAEVFGGDAAMPQNGQDNTWRYFVPSPACVRLNLVFELSVDKLLAVPGDTLVYTITGKNLSVNPQANVVVTDTFVPGDVAFAVALLGPAPAVGSGLLTWPTMTLAPGDTYRFQWRMTVTGNGPSTSNRATYTSAALPAPGFSVLALTDIGQTVAIDAGAVVTPTATTAGSNVHYTATITNRGTGNATINAASFVELTLPAGFSFCSTCPAPRINGVNVANPAISGDTLIFTSGLQPIPGNGGTMVVELDATVGPSVAPGLYTIDVQNQVRDAGVGRDVERSSFAVAPLLVDAVRSNAPLLDEPVSAGATAVTGVTSEGAGATVTVFVNGNAVAPVVAGALGVFAAPVPTLFAGQHLNATAMAAGEVVSVHSSPDVVVGGVSRLDPFHCFKAKTTQGAPKFQPQLGVRLVDAFEDALFVAKKPLDLCAPADLNGAGTQDPTTHLESYQITLEKGQPRHEKRTDLRVDNLLGTLFLDTVKPESLLVPTAKDATTPPSPPDPAEHRVDHYKCYKVKVTRGTPKLPENLEATLGDQLTAPPRRYLLKKPTRLCTPVEKNGEAARNPDHLLCYALKPTKGRCDSGAPLNAGRGCKGEADCGGIKGVTSWCAVQAKFAKVLALQTSNQFGSEQLDAVKDVEVCVPSLRTP